MRYCLVLYNDNNLIEINDFSSLKGCQDYNPNTLRDIVNFTHHFLDEIELKEFLKSHDLVPSDIQNYALGIVYFCSRDAAPKLLENGISYEADDYFYNPDNLEHFLITHLDDINIMACFLKKYNTYLRKVALYSEPLDYLVDGFNNFQKTGRISASYRLAMISFFKFFTTKKNKDNTFSDNFRNIRDLAMFVIDYLNQTYEPASYSEDYDTELYHLKLAVSAGTLTDEQADYLGMRITELEQIQDKRSRRKGNYATTKN